MYHERYSKMNILIEKCISFNSLAPRGCGSKLKSGCEHMLRMKFSNISRESLKG